MNIDVENLPDDPATLKKMLSQVMSRYQYLEKQFRIAQHKQFGKSIEGDPGQDVLFNEAEELVVETETAEEAIRYTRNKPTRIPYLKTYLVKLSFTTLRMKKNL
ncbi:transposase [Alteromonas sp. BL110]|uniref:transposase n=1 Tax=Alteromonas sp. BL110 TaxID=1714845 RepID=UPI001E28B62D|nr:transposase [Alteromonas sp. BL110]